MTDHSETIYYEAVESMADSGTWTWRVYRYDPSGNRIVVIGRSQTVYDSQSEASNAAADWCEDHGIDAELA